MATSIDNFKDLEELGINDENDSLTETFNKAANHLQTLLPNVDNQSLLMLYGYYKQGSQGICNSPKPSWFDMRAKSKWESWKKLGDMPKEEAKRLYIETIQKLDPNFDQSKERWVSVSVMKNQDNTTDFDKNLIYYIKEGDINQVSKILKGYKNINGLDEEGLGLIHWATDRGFIDILEILIKHGVDVNLKDSEGQTALHYASSCGHIDCIKLLLSNGADKNILDDDGQSPADVASDDSVKDLFK